MNRLPAAPSFHLDHDPLGRLVLTLPDGTTYVGIDPVRGFPISDPEHGLSLRNAEGREILWLDDLASLPAETRATLEAALAQREFLPKIRRVVSVSLQIDPCEWEVETDRGPTKFVVKSEESVRRLDDRRALVTDANGIRYLIPDAKSLDRNSRRILERYL